METIKQIQHLQQLAGFERVLKNYRPSDQTLKILQDIPLVLLVGPTASGRNTLINILVETSRYHSIISDTTRNKRANKGIMEQNGIEYWFKTEDEFLTGLRDGRYLEAAIIHRQQVSGINISQLEAATRAHKTAINEVEINGATHIHEYKLNTLCIFLLPPTFDIWMERIKLRGDCDDNELRRRLESAHTEISDALSKSFYQFVINFEIHEAAAAVDELANGRIVDMAKQRLGRDHAEQLLIDVQLFLAAQ
jgi:guanylate kinase